MTYDEYKTDEPDNYTNYCRECGKPLKNTYHYCSKVCHQASEK